MTTFTACRLLIFSTLLSAGTALAADSPPTAEVLGKLHQSNQKEIHMGQMAVKNGQAKEVKAFGKMLIKDHTAADKKVLALAKKQKIDLPAVEMMKPDDMSNMGTGADFDKKFAEAMLDDHKKDVAEASDARDKTTDEPLKKLLTAMVPTLQKHQDMAQKLVDGPAKK